MKFLGMILALVVVGATTGYPATINVDNFRPGSQYSNLQTAIDAANYGDTILVHPSPQSYGNVGIDKKLYIKGPGHHAVYTTFRAVVGGIGLKTGSDSTVIDGLYFTQSVSSNFYVKSHDIKIINNFFYGNGIRGQSNGCCPTPNGYGETKRWVVEGNIFFSNSTSDAINLGSSAYGAFAADWLIANNVFYVIDHSNSTGLFRRFNATTVLTNNVIIARSSYVGGNPALWSDVSGGIVENNIFYGHDPDNTNFHSGCSGCAFNNNLTYNPNVQVDSLPNGVDNLDNVDPQFVNLTNTNLSKNNNHVFQYVDDLNLESGSPALTAGKGNSQMGNYGGFGYFHPYGWSAHFPHLISIDSDKHIVPQGADVEVDVKVKRGGF